MCIHASMLVRAWEYVIQKKRSISPALCALHMDTPLHQSHTHSEMCCVCLAENWVLGAKWGDEGIPRLPALIWKRAMTFIYSFIHVHPPTHTHWNTHSLQRQLRINSRLNSYVNRPVFHVLEDACIAFKCCCLFSLLLHIFSTPSHTDTCKRSSLISINDESSSSVTSVRFTVNVSVPRTLPAAYSLWLLLSLYRIISFFILFTFFSWQYIFYLYLSFTHTHSLSHTQKYLRVHPNDSRAGTAFTTAFRDE